MATELATKPCQLPLDSGGGESSGFTGAKDQKRPNIGQPLASIGLAASQELSCISSRCSDMW
eukprot:9714262-Prorocentrum_lima.AAC.1